MTTVSMAQRGALFAGCALLAGAFSLVAVQGAFAQPITVQDGAAVALAGLSSGKYESKTVRCADIDADGAIDTVSYSLGKTSETYAYSSLTLKVNETTKVLLKNSYFFEPTVGVITLSDGTSLVSVTAVSNNEWVEISKLYSYDGSSIKEVFNCKNSTITFGSKYAHTANNYLTEVSGKTIKVECGTQPYACGYINYGYTYKYSSGAFKRTSSSASTSSHFYNLNTGKAYTYSPITASVKLYKSTKLTTYSTLSKGTNAKVIGAYLNDTVKLLKIQTKSGTKGYIKANVASYSKTPLFKYAGFAG